MASLPLCFESFGVNSEQQHGDVGKELVDVFRPNFRKRKDEIRSQIIAFYFVLILFLFYTMQ